MSRNSLYVRPMIYAKKSNRQIDPLFKRWVAENVIGVPVVNDTEEFLRRDDNCILNASDNIMYKFTVAILNGVLYLKNHGKMY